jgi:hypothetical protein
MIENWRKFELYIGGAIEHESERHVLELLSTILSARDSWSVVLANLEVEGRQIDFVVCTESLTLVIEAKHYSRRIRGALNGTWHVHLGRDAWKPSRNAYRQVLEQKNCLRDALRRFDANLSQYPDACVVVSPRVPEGSQLPAPDRKVAIASLEDLEQQLNRRSDLCLARKVWQSFAEKLGLERVQTIEAATSERLFEEERMLQAYRAGFIKTYEPDIRSYQDDVYLVNEQEHDASGVSRLTINKDENVLILGPSGCGKSLLTKRIAIDCLNTGCFPIIVNGKNFSGSLRDTISAEISLFDWPSAKTAIVTARNHDQPLVLIVDGYNECATAHQLTLTRSLAAFSRRYGARLLVSAQDEVARMDLLNLTAAFVREPTKALKVAIAEASAGRPVDETAALLDGISSGLEADMIGRVGAELPRGSSRFALYDAFTRSVLGTDDSDGIRFLTAFAHSLIERLSFSMSVRELDRLADQKGVQGALLLRILGSRLLSKRSDRVSFRHELFFAAFCAESAVRLAGKSPDQVLVALNAPKFKHCRTLILGAIEDSGVVSQVLDMTTDKELLSAGLAGVCGVAAREHLLQRRKMLIAKMTNEARNIRFGLGETYLSGAGILEDSIFSWSVSELAFIGAVAGSEWNEDDLSALLLAVKVMDESIERGIAELREEASEKKVALRTALFANAYMWQSGLAGLSAMIAHISGGAGFEASRRNDIVQRVISAFDQPRSHGQTYLLLSLVRFSNQRELILPYILPLLRDQWKRQPYHLQLKLIDFVHFIPDPSDGVREELIDTLRQLLTRVHVWLTGSVAEALERLGALEDEAAEHGDYVREEVKKILSNEMEPDRCARAWSVYSCQFDHPFSSIYSDVIQELKPDEEKRLLLMACQGIDRVGLFVDPLLQELLAHAEPSTVTAIERWTHLPEVNSFMPQEAVSVFVWAHIAIGRLGGVLPQDRGVGETDAAACLLAFGEIYYWSNRADLSETEVNEACQSAFNLLLRDDQVAAVAAFRDVVGIFNVSKDRARVLKRFPIQMLAMCRSAVLQQAQQVSYFPFHSGDRRIQLLNFAIAAIGEIGCQEDLRVLRGLCEQIDIGPVAFKAIQTIESRFQ